MENYSPSHPTDEIDFDSPCNENLNNFECGKSNQQTKELSKNTEFHKSRSRSKSKKRRSRSRSRSRNRRSRSRNKSYNKPRDYGSNNVSKRSRSREKRSDSRGGSHSKEYKSRNIGRRSRSREKRSRSNDSKKYIIKSRDCSSNYYPRSRDSPSQHRYSESRLNDRKNDNIFSKMSELEKPSDEQVIKSKWNYDSDEEEPSKKQDDSVIPEPTNRYDKKPFPRRNFDKDGSSVGVSNENDDNRPFPRRFEYNNNNNNNNRRGFDKSRGFGRNRPWEPRNSRSRYPPRNGSNFNRNNFGFGNDEESGDRWDSAKNSDYKNAPQAWNENNNESSVAERPSDLNNSPVKESIHMDLQQDKHGFAVDSDEECGNWGKAAKSNTIDEMLTMANLESQGLKKEDFGRKIQSRQSSPKVEKWSNEDNTLPNDDQKKNTFAENSDEEYGTWGSEQKSVGNKNSSDSRTNNQYGAWGSEQKFVGNKNSADSRTDNQYNDENETKSASRENVTTVSNKQAENDSDDDYGSWGKERKTFTSHQSNNSPKDQQGESTSSYGQPFYPQNPRPNFYRNNDGNQRFSQRRAGNNNFNRFQRPSQNFPQQERFNYNAGNLVNTQNFPNNFNAKPQHEMMSQMPMPPYSFNPSQRPPQWGGPINNMNCPPICNGQMPFTSMPLLPQMQFPQMSQQQQQLPPMSIPNMMQGIPPYIPPPPPATNQISTININSSNESNNFNPPVKINDSTNLLETIMTNVGLSSKTIRMQSDILKPPVPASDSLSNIIKSAASTVLSRLVENSQKSNINTTAVTAVQGNVSDNMSMSPPSPSSSSPQGRHIFDFPGTKESSDFVLPPLPNYSDILKPSNAVCTTGSGGGGHSNSNNMNQTMEINEEKRNRSDFESKGDWQERIALEVKNFLKPAYMNKRITKSDYKEIMKRCVTKISRSGVTEINTEKIEKFVLSYVDKYQKLRKVKQHGVVSSSEHELVM